MTFATYLQLLIADAGVTAYRLSVLSGIPKQSISRYLRGEDEPNLWNALLIAKVLRISTGEFDRITESVKSKHKLPTKPLETEQDG